MIHVPGYQDDDFVFAVQHRQLIKLDKQIWPNKSFHMGDDVHI